MNFLSFQEHRHQTMYDNINIISSKYHSTIDGIREVIIINDFEPLPLVDLLDSLQASSCYFMEGMGDLENFDAECSKEQINAVRSLMLVAFSAFYDIDAWCVLDEDDTALLAELQNPGSFRIKVDGILREIDHCSTICHGLSRHTFLYDYLHEETI